ncbi:calcium-binding protein [Streptomyces sp. NBC_01361]|uniref:calcium-binding protein n=1 Tax=Streptomyces sp. NBC_01361 TaxID=2903838 RepID=UPI002E3548F7|nr:calcium-binding protein [Streptomyces sp. NBC_01361]
MPTLITGLRRTLGRSGAAAATGLALVLTAPGAALAAPGDLDPGFDGDGRVVTDFGGYDESRDMALQADGKIVTVGLNNSPQGDAADFTLARYNTNGSLDAGFDGDGLVLTDVSGGDEDIANGVAVQPDGKIVVVGRSGDPVSGGNRFTVVRYNSNGSLDTGFDGDGIARTDFGAGGPQEAFAVTVQANGAIVAVGESGANVALARYNPDGSLDTGFDGDGKVTTGFAGGSASAYDVAMQSDGRIVVTGRAGYNFPANASDFALARYNSDGSLDTGFSGDGKVTTPFADADVAAGVKVQTDGKIVVAGTSDFDFALARYNPDGSLDTGFSGDGKVATSFGAGTLDGSSDLALQSDGKIVAAGISQADFAVARYNADGSLDGGFGTGGKVTTDVSTFGYFDTASAVAVQSDGKIVASGNTGDDRGLVRYQVTGTPPPTGVDLSVTKTGQATVSLGDQATYTVTVTNKSTTTAATGVTLTDTLSGPGTVLSATPAQGTCTITSTSANCALGSLAAGASTTVKVVAEPRTGTGTLSDKATVTATQTDPVPANNSATATSTVNNAHGCTITGTSGADTLTGGWGNDVICALSGNDTVRASYGSDTVYGGPGNDNIDGGFDNDTLIGGPGNDTLTGYFGNDRLNTVDNVSGNDTANGGLGTDTCTTDPGDGRVSCP